MPIQVVCPGCHARFKVSDKFAGQKGPCPKCKKPIQVPSKSDEVVVHEPEAFGPKGASGQAVLKPLEREEAKFSWVVMGIIGGVVLLSLLAALIMRSAFRGDDGLVHAPLFIKVFGAIILAPPLVFAGYTFLRNQELEPYRGMSLWIRVGICSLVYAILWGAFGIICEVALGGKPEMFELLFIGPVIAIGGAVAAFASLDLDFGSAFLHYALYLLVTVTLLLIMGDPPFAALS